MAAPGASQVNFALQNQSWSWAEIIEVLIYRCFQHSWSGGYSNPEVFPFLI